MDQIKNISIAILTKGYLVSGASSPNTLGAMSTFSAACQTPQEVIAEISALLGLSVAPVVKDALLEKATAALESAVDAVVQQGAPAAEAPSIVTQENREEVIKFLISRGHDLPKGVRTTTLERLLADERIKPDAGVAKGADAETPHAVAPEDVFVESKPVNVCKMCQGTGKIPGDVDCPHCAKGGDLTMEIVRGAVNSILNKNVEKRAEISGAAKKAVEDMGLQRFPDIKDFNAAWPKLSAEIAKVLAPAVVKEDDQWEM